MHLFWNQLSDRDRDSRHSKVMDIMAEQAGALNEGRRARRAIRESSAWPSECPPRWGKRIERKESAI